MDYTFANRTGLMKRSTIREILKLTALPDVISFAGGLPASETFPVERMKEAAETILAERPFEALQYSTTEGMPELRDLLAARFSTEKLTITRDNILIVSGSQQALDLIGRVFLDAGDKVVIENPTYLGMLMAWRPFDVEFLPIATDEQGLIPGDAEPLFAQNPKLAYVVPTFQNPTGVTLSTERRIQLAKLVAEHKIPLIEDNAYGELRYSGDPAPSLYACDAENLGIDHLDGHVIYCGTFSKILSPGMRVGWVVAPEMVIDKLIQAKQSADLHTSTFNQFLCYEVAKDGFLDAHIERIRDIYRARRDTMLAAMESEFPEGVTWAKPEGGLFLMVYLPDHIDAAELLKEAISHKVAFIPGADLHVHGVGGNTMRLNFSASSQETIAEGIRRLGMLLKEQI